jgi:hypothetical protein
MANKTINELTLKLNADVAELKADLAGAKTQLSNFNKGVASIGASIKSAFAVGAIVAVGKQLFDFGKELSTIGGLLAGTKMNFDKLNEPGLLKELRAATGGTVSDLELMKAALNADDMKVPLDKLSGFFRYARNEVQETGGSVTQLVDTLITGLGKDSTKALAQLGISTATYKEELAKTGDMMTAVSNIINQKLKDSGQYIETAADITARWGARWENLKGNIGLLINEGIKKIGPYLEVAYEWGKKFFETIIVNTRKAVNHVIDFINGWIDLYNKSMLFRAAINAIIASVKNMWEVFKAVGKGIWTIFSNLGAQIGYALNPKNWGDGFMDGLAKIQKEGSNKMVEIGKTFGKNIADNIMTGLENTIKDEVKLIKLPELTINDIELNISSNEPIKKLNELGNKAGAALARSLNEGIQSIEIKPFENLKQIDLGKTVNIGAIKQNMAQFTETMQNAGKVAVETTELLQNALADGFSMIGESIGDMMSGAGGIQSIFKGFLGVLSSFMAAFGKVLISIGVAKMALDKIFINPAGAIIAGVALIALSKIASNMMAKQKFAAGGIVGGYSYAGDRVPVLANSGEMILNSAQQGNLFDMINKGATGGAGELIARVSGNDLLFVLEQTKNRRLYTY